MSYNFIKDHTLVNYSPGNSGRLYIVIHYTGNVTDSAAGNANYFRNADRGSSAHYFVDKTSVYEVVSPDNTSWAVGVNYGGRLFGICSNYNSINIEMCSDNGVIAPETFNNTIELIKKLMKQFGIPADRVVRHYDVCGKNCPGWAGWLPGNESLWNNFKSKLIGASDASGSAEEKKEEMNMQCFYQIKGQGCIYYFDGINIHPLGHPDEVTVLNMIYKANNGKDMPSFVWTTGAPWHKRLEAAIGRKK